MQDGIIDFIDIKLQSAEVTRYKLRSYMNTQFKAMKYAEKFIELDLRRSWLKESVDLAYYLDLIGLDVKFRLGRLIEDLYVSRRDELREREENE